LGAISERTKLDKDGVEFLLMKALSLKLIKGTIDEVQQTVQVRPFYAFWKPLLGSRSLWQGETSSLWH
jgi:hypothetical protein